MKRSGNTAMLVFFGSLESQRRLFYLPGNFIAGQMNYFIFRKAVKGREKERK